MTAYASALAAADLNNPLAWTPNGTPAAGDTITVNAGHVITVSANATLGSNAAALGHAATVTGELRIAAGVTLTLRGYDRSANLLLNVTSGGIVRPYATSTILGDLASDFQSVAKILGHLVANDDSGPAALFSVPAANVSWAKAIAIRSITNVPYYDYDHSIHVAALTDADAPTWATNISNAAHAAEGSPADTSFASEAGSTSDHSVRIATIAETSLTALIAAAIAGTPYGHYYLDHNNGLLYFYCTNATPTIQYTAYRLDRRAANWKGWGIVGGAATGSSFAIENCRFEYMGTGGGGYAAGPSSQRLQCPINLYSLPPDTLSIQSSTFRYCFQAISLDTCSGDIDHVIPIDGNDLYAGSTLQFNDALIWLSGGSSFLDVNANALQTKGPLVGFTRHTAPSTVGGSNPQYTSVHVSDNDGVCAGFIISGTGSPLPRGEEPAYTPSATPGLYCQNNTLDGGGASYDGRAFQNLCGSAATPAILEDSYIHHYHRLGPLGGGYLTIRRNTFGHCYHHGWTGSTTEDSYATDHTIENNLFYSDTSATGPDGSPSIILGYNHRTRIHRTTIESNDQSGDRQGLLDLGDSQDNSVCHATRVICTNNAARHCKYAMQRDPDGSATTDPKNRMHVEVADWNSYSDISVSQRLAWTNTTNPTTAEHAGAIYNQQTSAARNVTGIALYDATYTTDQTARSLVYAVNTLGTDHTLSWGAGTPVQLIQDHGTSAGQGRRTIACVGKSWAWASGTSNFDTKMNWLWIHTGTNAGQASTITRATANTAYAATINAGGSGWTIGQHARVSSGGTLDTGGYNTVIRVTGVSGGAVTAVEILSGGTYATPPTNPVTMSRIEGSAGASLTLNFSWAPGLWLVPDLPASCDGTSQFAIVLSEVTLNDGSGGTIRAATLLGDDPSISLPTTSQTDTGITIATTHTSTADPQWEADTNPPSNNVNDYRWLAGSPLENAGNNANAPSDDYYGTSRPQDATVDIGLYELPYTPPTPPTPSPSAQTRSHAKGPRRCFDWPTATERKQTIRHRHAAA